MFHVEQNTEKRVSNIYKSRLIWYSECNSLVMQQEEWKSGRLEELTPSSIFTLPNNR